MKYISKLEEGFMPLYPADCEVAVAVTVFHES